MTGVLMSAGWRVCRAMAMPFVAASAAAMIAAVALIPLRTAGADTITVCPSGCNFTNVQSAINASVSGDLIEIAAGTYAPSATLNTNGKAITIRGAVNADGTPATTIDGQGARQVFNISNGEGSGTILENLVITGGSATYGGGLILSGSSPTLTNCVVSGNTATGSSGKGGGLYLEYSGAMLTNCQVSGNTAQDGGGLDLSASNPTLTNCVVSGNTATSSGGGLSLWYSSSPTLTNCEVSGNTVTGSSGQGG
ncbi:MAG: right-handed parallel beta-helix repeat-containing protein, partial [Planctomycetota bacterium]|nr:right-handed parallel beta-helix repeat-containing protein [Planctomycetota bacterium]